MLKGEFRFPEISGEIYLRPFEGTATVWITSTVARSDWCENGSALFIVIDALEDCSSRCNKESFENAVGVLC